MSSFTAPKKIVFILCITLVYGVGWGQVSPKQDSSKTEPQSSSSGTSSPSSSRNFALLVGISKYKQMSPLRFADKDARDFTGLLREQFGENIEIDTLLNEEASSSSIRNWLSLKANFSTHKNSRVYILLSGHGGTHQAETKNGYFYTTDYESQGAASEGKGVIEMGFLLDNIRTLLRKGAFVFLVIDACHAGSYHSEKIRTSVKELGPDSTTNASFLAALETEKAYESSDLQNGILSYYFINGANRILNEGRAAQVHEMRTSLSQSIQQEENKNNHHQTPLVLGNDSLVVFALNPALNKISMDSLTIPNTLINNFTPVDSSKNIKKKFDESIRKKDLDDAYRWLNEYKKFDSDSSEMYHKLKYSYVGTCYEEAVDLSGNLSDFYVRIEFEPDSIQKLASSVSERTRLNSQIDTMLLHLGHCLQLLTSTDAYYNEIQYRQLIFEGHRRKRVSDIDSAVDINPDFGYPYLILANLYLINNQIEKGREQLYKYFSLVGDDEKLNSKFNSKWKETGDILKINSKDSRNILAHKNDFIENRSRGFLTNEHSPEKYALIIAIGKYKYWNDINSINDQKLMQQTLERQGFKSDNILTITDTKATKAGIEHAFEELIQRVPAGSIVVCHFSGHGQQISDDNGDEPDGLDEALIPYDAPMFLSQKVGYDGRLHLRDDELDQWVHRLRTKLGTQGHLLLLLDSSHSGNDTRGSAKVHGGATPLLLPNARPTFIMEENGSGLFEGKSRGDGSTGLANYVVISATKANEENREAKDASGQPVGSLTYAVSQAFANLNSSIINYYQFYGRIMNSMAAIAPYQTPTIEGDSKAALLNGEYVKIKPYYSVLALVGDNEIRLDGGQLMGVFKGSKVAIYGSGETPVATGEVLEASALLALIKLNNMLPNSSLLKEYRAYITQQTFGDLSVRLKVETSDEALLASLKEVPYIELTKTEPIDLLLRSVANDFQLYTAAEGLPFGKAQKNEFQCTELVRNYVQTKILKTVDLIPDSSLHLELTIVPLEIIEDKLTGRQTAQKTGYPLGDIPSFRNGMQADFILENTGSNTLYVTGVDISPDGLVNVLFPKPNEPPIEYKIDAGKSKIIRLQFGPPYGTETIKLYATSNPIDLRPIINTRGQDRSRSNPEYPIEQFYRQSYLRTRDETIDPPPVQSGRVLAFTFQMIE